MCLLGAEAVMQCQKRGPETEDEIQKNRPLRLKWLPPLCCHRYPKLTPSQRCPK